MALDTVFLALSDPTRRVMLVALRHGEKSVGELARPHSMSLAGASKHIGVLERAGLIVRRKEGRRHLCRLRVAPLREADAWLREWERFWTTRLDALETLINEKPK
jgi:DNA-binding transcriptional ArsR family regulator